MNTHLDSRYSAILTCHNAQETIERAIKGILSQNLPPFEIIIVDDFSVDSSVELINKLMESNVVITLIQNKANMGQSWSRNHAISIAKTDFAIIFDDDDFSLPNRASEHMLMFKRGASLNFVSSRKIYENGHEIDLCNKDIFLNELSPRAALLSTLTGVKTNEIDSIAIPASTSAVSVQEFRGIGGYDERFRRLEDAELFIRFSERKKVMAWSSQILVHRFATQNNKKGGSIESAYELQLLNKFEYLMAPREYKFAKNLIEIRASYFSKDYLAIFCQLVVSPTKCLILIKKWKKAVSRIMHDIKQGRKL
jgi:glycosyltransferase involved in cell wall biosynthesis